MEAAQQLYLYLAVSAALFTLGTIGVLTRRNGIVVFMCIELMLNAANLSLMAFSRYLNDPQGAMLVFFSMVVAAAEAVVGLAIIIAIFRGKQDVDVNNINLFKW